MIKTIYKILLVSISLCLSWMSYSDNKHDLISGNPNVSNKIINIYWSDHPPILDGKMDDECWKTASVASGFEILKGEGKPASQQTEVYICYDAENLYTYWKVYEENMKEYIPGPPPDTWDIICWEERIQLVLDPECTRKQCFMFNVSPLGAQADRELTGAQLAFNCRWQVKTGCFEKGWTVEMAIPFTEVMNDSQLRMTPQVGDCWGINFNRIRSLNKEKSQWSLTGGSFGSYGCLGRAFFKGRRNPPQIPKVTVGSRRSLFFGFGKLDFKITGDSEGLKVENIIINNGEIIHKKEISVIDQWHVAYDIFCGGKWTVKTTLFKNKKPLFTACTWRKLPPIIKTLEEVEKKLSDIIPKLKLFKHPVVSALENKVRDIEERLKYVEGILKRTKTLTKNEWEELVDKVAEIKKKWKTIKFDVNLMRLYPLNSNKIQAFAAGNTFPDEKIYPNTVYTGSVSTPIRLSLAGNEYRSFQLIIIPFWQDLHNVSVSFSDLGGKGDTISAENISWFIVDYVRMLDTHPLFGKQRSHEPDILWPGRPFSITKGTVRSVWVDVYLPKDTPAGEYEGKIYIKANNQIVERDLMVNSYGFDLPDKNSVKQDHWFLLWRWNQFYDHKLKYTPEKFEKHIKTLSRYRVPPFFFDGALLWKQIPIYREPDGSFTFDFSILDEYIRIARKYNATAFWASLGCDLGGIWPFLAKHAQRVKVIDRKTGKKVKMAECVGDWPDKFKEGDAFFDTHPVYRDYLKAYVKHLKDIGILDISYFEIYDEAHYSESRWLNMLKHHKFLKTYVPELKLHSFGANPESQQAGKNAIGFLDVWAPHLYECEDQKMLEKIYERRKTYGEEFWIYTCCEKQGGKTADWSPHTMLSRSYLGPRIIPWFAWKYKVDGFLIYMLSNMPKENRLKISEKRWPQSEWEAGYMRGNGTLIYPGPDLEIFPSIRLAMLRDGNQDYEYFALLKKKLSLLDPGKDAELIKKAEKELNIEPEIIEGVYDWTKDINMLDSKRGRLAEYIKKIDNEKTQ